MKVDRPTGTASSKKEWRYYHSAETLNPPGHVFVSESITYNGETFNLRAPSAPALFLSAAVKARDSAAVRFTDLGAVEYSEFFDCLEALATCIAFSFTAIEAFANEELPGTLVYMWKRKGKPAERLEREDVERFVDLAEKLDGILPGSKGVESPKGTKLWQDFVWLKDIRNRLVHLKRYPTGFGPPAGKTREHYLWQRVLDPRVRDAPEIAFGMIRHFLPFEAVPSWIKDCPLNEKLESKKAPRRPR